jgi:hypothetical protein
MGIYHFFLQMTSLQADWGDRTFDPVYGMGRIKWTVGEICDLMCFDLTMFRMMEIHNIEVIFHSEG